MSHLLDPSSWVDHPRNPTEGGQTMNRIVVRSKVGADGVLHLTLPLEAGDADQEVQVTVEPVPSKKVMTPEEWRTFVMEMAGSITDPTFERPPQGELEQREPLS
jgi:hypothetical protein